MHDVRPLDEKPPGNGRRTLVLQSDLTRLQEVLDFVERFANDHGLDQAITDRICLVSSEAATNAMKHGNELDREKHVTCEICLFPSYVELSVADDGPGFEITGVRDPLAEENLLRDSGRGLYFIRHFTDEISYEKHPSIVRLRFHLDPVD